MDISFKFDPEILIGSDTLSMAGTVAGRHGSRIMVAADHGLEGQAVSRLKEILEDSRLEAIIFDGIDDNSSVELADNIVELGSAAHCDAIIGFGGLKTQIIARMAAIMAPSKTRVFELLDGKPSESKFLPFISIPTESMDAFSLTNSFLAVDPRHRLVKSINSPSGIYSAIIIDNSLFGFLSGNNASAFVFECFFFAVEAYCSARANFFSDTVLEKSLNFFAKLLRSGNGISAEGFSQASFLSSLGSCASSPGVGAALSAAINARSSVAKPLCSAALFPVIAERLVSARPEKMARVASFLGNTKAASVTEAAASAVDSIRRTMTALNIPLNLQEHNIPIDRLTAAAEAARSLDLTAYSPWTVSEEEIFKILKDIL